VFWFVGTRSFKQTINFDVWAYCYVEYARKACHFFPTEFEQAATAILSVLHICRQDITEDSARSIYLHLCDQMQ